MDYKGFFQEKYHQTEDPWHFETSLYERVRHAAMTEFALAQSPQRILDLGCGEGHFLSHLLARSPKIEATGVELVSLAAERCRSRLSNFSVQVWEMDLLDYLAQEHETRFDLCICGDVLYYLTPEVVRDRVLPGLDSIVRPGGAIIISYADVNNHDWLTEVFAQRFRLDKQVYIKPMQEPPPWPWVVTLFRVEG